MPLDKTKHNCSGCTACASICPKDCISMVPDALGFKYPEVDLTRCINCDLCVKVCPFHSEYKTPHNLEKPIFYVGKHHSPEVVKKSQSGAAFVALSDWILTNGGVIYGVGYGEHFRAVHKKATNKEQRDEFRGSKYVQSDLGDIFKQVKKDLQDGLIVMFTGTPCQTAGIKSFIPEALQENLYVMDIVCHGVPGPKIWDDYLLYLERKSGKKISKTNFRDKSLKGWRSHVESFLYEGDTYTYTYTYTYLFYSHINLRYSCGSCPFTNLRRTGDITVCDAWGVENSEAKSLGEDNKGCSLFIINNLKGERWFEAISSTLTFQKLDDYSSLVQPQLQKPTVLHPLRTQYEEDYIKEGFAYTKKKYGHPSFKIRVKRLIRKSLPSPIFNIIKKILNR